MKTAAKKLSFWDQLFHAMRIIITIFIILLFITENAQARDKGLIGSIYAGLGYSSLAAKSALTITQNSPNGKTGFLDIAYDMSIGYKYKRLSIFGDIKCLSSDVIGKFLDPEQEDDDSTLSYSIALSSIKASFDIVNCRRARVAALIGYGYFGQDIEYLIDHSTLLKHTSYGGVIGANLHFVPSASNDPDDNEHLIIGFLYETGMPDFSYQFYRVSLGYGVLDMAYLSLNFSYIKQKNIHNTFYLSVGFRAF